MSQRPPGPSNAAIAACPSKKLPVRRSTTRFAVCSLPIAKVARWVLGVIVEEVINGPEDLEARVRRRFGLNIELAKPLRKITWVTPAADYSDRTRAPLRIARCGL